MPEYNAVFGEDEPELPAKRVKLIDEREMRLLVQTNSVIYNLTSLTLINVQLEQKVRFNLFCRWRAVLSLS